MAFDRTIALFEKYKGYNRFVLYRDIVKQHGSQNNNITVDVCKAILEGFAKTYLIENNIHVNLNDDFPKLLSIVVKNTPLIQTLSNVDKSSADKIASGLNTVINGINEFRNKYPFISHGQHPQSNIIDDVLTDLVLECSDIWASFLLNSIARSIERVQYEAEYEKNTDFNQWYDNGIDAFRVEHNESELEFLPSEILFHLDPTAYQEKLSLYLSTQPSTENNN